LPVAVVGVSLASPPYTALTACGPETGVVVQLATSGEPPLSATDWQPAIGLPLSVKLTVPVGGVVSGGPGLTVSVSVTDAPAGTSVVGTDNELVVYAWLICWVRFPVEAA